MTLRRGNQEFIFTLSFLFGEPSGFVYFLLVWSSCQNRPIFTLRRKKKEKKGSREKSFEAQPPKVGVWGFESRSPCASGVSSPSLKSYER